MKTAAIIPAAGSGTRLGSKTPKVFLKAAGKPLLVYPLLELERIKEISEVVLVVPLAQVRRSERIVRQYNLKKVRKIIAGGNTRSRSVLNGLNAIELDADFVIIHDGARPLVSRKIIRDCLKAAVRTGAAVSAVPCVNTIKSCASGLKVAATLDRSGLWEAHTPQVFRAELLRRAYEKAALSKTEFFDDSQLVEKTGGKVRLVPGSRGNFKVTSIQDLVRVRELLERRGRG